METIIDYFLGKRYSLFTVIVLITVAGYAARRGLSLLPFLILWAITWALCLTLDAGWQHHRQAKRNAEIDALWQTLQEKRKAWADDDE